MNGMPAEGWGALTSEQVCICKAWTIHCACGKSVSHADVAKLRAEVLRLEQRHALAQCGFEALQNIVAELRCANERLREERRWIPVGERLPEDEADVICGYAGFKSFPGYRQGFNWFDERDSHLAFPPTHWQPLPAPPKEEEQ